MTNAAPGAALPTTDTGLAEHISCISSSPHPATTNRRPELRALQQDGVDFDLAVVVVARRFALTFDHAKVVASLAGLGPTGAD